MKIINSLLMALAWPFLAQAYTPPVSTSSSSRAVVDNKTTLHSVGGFNPYEREPSSYKKRSQERTFTNSFITGKTGLNALIVKTRKLETPVIVPLVTKKTAASQETSSLPSENLS